MSKYGRTYHLPWSPGTTSDDKISNDISSLIGSEIVITEKDFKDNVAKWVRKDHVQTDDHWTRNWKKSKINY